MKSRSRITSVEATVRAFGALKRDAGPKVRDGVQAVCEAIQRSADARCPVDTGRMLQTSRIIVEGAGMATRGTVEYGGTQAPYTIFQHENLNYKHAPGKEAKWLERAVMRIRSSGAATKLMGRAFKSRVVGVDNEAARVITQDAGFGKAGDL